MSQVRLRQSVPDTLGGMRLDQAVAAMFPDYSRSRLKGWIVDGSLTLDGATARPRDKVLGGESVVLAAELDDEAGIAAQPVAFPVAYEDRAVLVIDKPAGLVVHPGAGNRDGTLQHGLLYHYPELAELPRGGIVHRLDKETSGLLLIARTLPAHTRLVRALAERRIEREYVAVCNGVLTAGGRIDAAIGRHPTQRTKMAVVPGGRPSLTHYRVVERFRAHTLVRVRLETGRTHQIRVHMAHIRHPLVGDPLYGARIRLPPGADEALAEAMRGFRRQALHAARLAFEHPESGERIEVESPPPADFEALCDALRRNAAEAAVD